MTPGVTVLSLELLVPRIDDALSVLVDTLGFELVHRGPSPDVSAEVAVLDAGSIAITLIQPVDGSGPMIPDVTARLSQLVIGVEGGSLATVVAALAEAGLPIEAVDDTMSFVPPAAMEGAVGFPMALVMQSADADPILSVDVGTTPP